MHTIFYSLTKSQQLWLKTNFASFNAKYKTGVLSVKNLPPKNTEIISIHSDSLITQEILQKLPNLKLIVTRTVGVDHIDLAACHRSKVAVANNPGLNSIAVAEFTFGMLLTYQRHIIKGVTFGKQLRFNDENLIGAELFGKTIGIVGTGAIGSHVARIAKGFGMKILGYDTKRNLSNVQRLGMKYLGLKQLVQQSDIITLHIPATPLTEQLFDRTLLSYVKPGAVLVNMARGSVIDPKAVLHFLDKGLLSAYLADVVHNEHQLRLGISRLSGRDELVMRFQRQLVKHPHTFFTPHIAHATAESGERILRNTVQIIRQFERGKKIQTIL
jgi:D-lactate dehydrogenase